MHPEWTLRGATDGRRSGARVIRHVTAVVGLCAGIAPAVTVVAQTPRVERDIAYRPGATPEQTLDLHLPAADGFPTVVFVHGGSLRVGSDRSSAEYARVCEPFAAADVACATIDYRVAPEHRWPAMPEDVAAAVRRVRDEVAERGGDPSRLFVFGHSSGCHLAAVLGTNRTYLEEAGLSTADLAGIVLMGCILTPLDPIIRRAHASGFGLDSLRALWNARRPDGLFATFDDRLDSDPSRFVGDHVPPTLIVIAEEERFRPPALEQAARFVDLMYEARRPADIVIVPGSHRTSIAGIVQPGDPTLAAILAFMEDPNAAGAGSRGW